MKVLLVHPEDDLPSGSCGDLIVDLGRAPAATYERWSRQSGSIVTGIYDSADGVADLHLCRKLLASGMGCLLDEHGIDWWDVLSLRLVPDLQQLILFDRLLRSINSPVQIYATRPLRIAKFFPKGSNPKISFSAEPFGFSRRGRNLWRTFRSLDHVQVAQIVQDKFDRNHAIRRMISRKQRRSSHSSILLPSAYVNVTRMAVRYAELLPTENFLLVSARRSGQLKSLPTNVAGVSLDAYFESPNVPDTQMIHEWGRLRKRLVQSDPIFARAQDCGILEHVESDLQWSLRIRDAWINVLDRENVAACFCADDTNPYTRIALLVTKARGLPTVACHHGALDYYAALKNPAADYYLAKTELERNYLINRSGISREKVLLGGPGSSFACRERDLQKRNWIVWFTEGYGATGWRSQEVYQDLLPQLYSLAQSCGLKLVLKLHPFDSVRDHRHKLRNILKNQAGNVDIIDGPANTDLWENTRFALTAESSVALECAARKIPIFLCTWLQDCYSGYAEQYAKFGVGIPLRSSEQVSDIPRLLALDSVRYAPNDESIAPQVFKSLFTGPQIRESVLNEQTFAGCAI